MTILFDHTDRDGDRITISALKWHLGGDDVMIYVTEHVSGNRFEAYATRADLVAALGAVTEQEFADMSTLAKKNLSRYETALAERDRARDTAARLEAENADLTATCDRQRVELARLNGHGAPTSDPGAVWEYPEQPDPWSETHQLLTSILDAVTALKPRVTKTRVEYHVVTPESAHRHDCD